MSITGGPGITQYFNLNYLIYDVRSLFVKNDHVFRLFGNNDSFESGLSALLTITI